MGRNVVECRLEFRKTGFVIETYSSPGDDANDFSHIDFATYSVIKDAVVVCLTDRCRVIYKRDGPDLLQVEAYNSAGEKEVLSKMERFVRQN